MKNKPNFKIWLCPSKPFKIRKTDRGIWRRINLNEQKR